MKIPLVHRRMEGTEVRNGLNWDINPHSRIVLILRVWRFYFYFRIRSEKVEGKKFLWDVDYARPLKSCGVEICWDSRTIKFEGIAISLEALDLLCHPNPRKIYRFTRDNGFVSIQEVGLEINA